MTIGRLSCALFTLTLGATLLWGQSDTTQTQDDANRNVPPAAYGQENPPMVVNENPPISGLDRPSLEPQIQPRSMLLGGVEASESLDSNFGSDARTAWRSVTRGLAGLTMQRLWNRYQFAGAYVGGASYYNGSGIGLQQMHELQAQQAFLWRTGQFTVRDSVSYLPEGAFGYGGYGGAGGFQLGLGSLGEGLGMLGSGFGGHFGVLGSNQLGSLGQGPRLTNVAIADVVQGLSPRSSLTAAGAFGFVHFDHASQAFGGAQGLINSQQVAGQVGYSYSLTPKDQIGFSYGFQSFHFPASLEGTENVGSHVVQGMYGHRISGRMDFVIGAGPQWTHLHDPLTGGSSRLSGAGRATLRYRFHVTLASLSFERYDTKRAWVIPTTSGCSRAWREWRRPPITTGLPASPCAVSLATTGARSWATNGTIKSLIPAPCRGRLVIEFRCGTSGPLEWTGISGRYGLTNLTAAGTAARTETRA